VNRHGIPLEDPQPALRYDHDGNLYSDFPAEIADHPSFAIVRFLLTNDLAPEVFDWEPLASTLWLRWDIARLVEERVRRMWPAVTVVAAANPAYGHRPPRLAERAAQLMGAGR